MPNRIIKDSIKTSMEIDQLTWFEEVLFYRLIVSCDDYGRYDGRPIVLLHTLFPTKAGVSLEDVEAAVKKLSSLHIVFTYEVDGKPILQMTTWDKHQQVRAKKSKYPAPESMFTQSDSNGNQMKSSSGNHLKSSDSKCPRNPIQSNTNTKSKIESNPNPIDAQKSSGDAVDGSTMSDPLKDKMHEWLQYKRERKDKYQPTGLRTLIAKATLMEQEYGARAVIDEIDTAMSSNWAGIAWDRLKKHGVQPNKKVAEDVLLKIIQEES